MINRLHTIIDKLTAPSFGAFRSERDTFYEDLAEAIKDGESMQEFLDSKLEFCAKHRRKKLALAYRQMIARLEENEGRLSHVLGGIAPADDIMSLHGIDRTDEKEDRVSGLTFLANLVRLDRTIIWSFRKALITPILVGPVMLAFSLVIALAFIPQYDSMLSHDRWPLIGKMIYWYAQAVTNFWPAMLVAVAAGVYGFVWSFPNWIGPLRSKFDNYLPYRLYRDRQSAKFMGALTSLMAANVQIVDALQQMRERANPWLNWHINKILRNIEEHPDDYGAIFDTGIFSPTLHEKISNYSRRARNSEDEEDGLARMGVEGIQQVLKDVEKASGRISVISAYVTVAVMIFFYGGNMVVGNTVRVELKKDAEQQMYEAQR